ncbi:hypothetical protein ACQUFY_26405 (plasmid) [Robbsia andropogonis]|uniref:hypothetical protein n=1 Tax=Robbsia andropogonis TaxID=28092 RepID=UPI003D1B3EA5
MPNREISDRPHHPVHAPIGSLAVHPELGKVEVFAVDGDMREVRFAEGEEYRHVFVHAHTLSSPSIDDLLGIRTHEDRILTRLLVGGMG